MYKLTFDDKPEANTYVKWARGKGYLVEGPYRERLSKTVKKFDLNGKRKKYGFVVLRKRGTGKEGGDVAYVGIPEKANNKKKKGRSVTQAKAELRQRAIAQGVMKEEMPKADLIHGMFKDLPQRYKENVEKLAAKKARAKVITTTDYWETNPGEIRRIATKMGIPSDKPLPKVLVMEKGAGKEYSESPMLVKSSLEADKASGYVINIPESMLKRVTKKGKETNYILGSRVKENIRHELAHYEERSKTGEETGQEKTPYDEAVKEIKTDMRAKVKSMPRALALQSYRLKEKYGLGDKEAFKVIEKAAKDLGVKKVTITRARDWEITSKAEPQTTAKDAIHEKLMADASKMPIGSKSPEVKAPKKIPERLIEDASKLPIGSRAPLEPKKSGSPKGSGKKISSKLQPLAAEAAKYDKFDDFEKAFSHEIRHGRYYHVTDNPNFALDPSTGPKDASSMAGKPVPAKGKLMITSDLDNWAAEYKGKRQYVAIIDMSEVPKEKYWQVNRGFGNEFWVDDPSRAKVIKVVPMTQAKVDSRLHHKALPSSKEELKGFYEKAKEGKPKPPKQAKAEIPIQPEIKKVMTGAKPSIVTNPRDYWDTHLENNPLRKGGQDTDAGAFTSWMIEAAGDVLRESHKHKASYTDPAYINAKLSRIERELKSRDWTDPISAGEQERLAKTRKLLEDLPAKTHKDKVIKRLIEGTVKRDREQTSEALREVKQHLVEEKVIKQSIKERKHVPLKELRKHREVVKEEHEARKEAKAYKERVREYKERAEKADREEAKYWEEHKETPEQQSREEEVEALKAEAEAYEKSGVVKESAA